MRTIIYFFLLTVASAFADPPPGYTLVKDYEFPSYGNTLTPGTGWGPLVSPYRFIEHTPYSGDFGTAYFTGPNEPNGDGPGLVPPNPFDCYYASLRIKQYLDPVINHWRSGMVATIDTHGAGFSQSLGYWEARIWTPAGAGIWPSFWLAGVNGIFHNRTTDSAEIDIFEAYGADLTHIHCNLHNWTPTGQDVGGNGKTVLVPTLANAWHIYGCLINSDFIHYYFDGHEVATFATPQSATLPLYAMIDFAQTSDHSGALNPNYLRVAYLKCWAP
jgi:hypothetical protein